MNRIQRAIQPYFSQTSSLKYSYLSALPLLVLYEVLIYISQPDSDQFVRLSTDIWLKSIFAYFGFNTLKFTFALAFILGVYIFFRERENPLRVRVKFFLYMILESIFYAIVLAMLISGFIGLIFNMAPGEGIAGLTKLQQFALSLGAGLYEELVFRVILVSALLLLFKWLNFGGGWKHAAAMITAALLFSAMHYIGPFGDNFTVQSFLFRFLFGLALNGLLIYRGFGIAAWTHSLYDVIVVVGS
jgi:membrane protease YdiL (CAAX protease family)